MGRLATGAGDLGSSQKLSATPRVLSRRVATAVFGRALSARLSAAAKAEIAAAGFGHDSAMPEYAPYEVWLPAIRVAARDMFPGISDEAALEKLGMVLVEDLESYLRLPPGVSTLARWFGPRRVIEQGIHFLQKPSVPFEVTAKRVDDREVVLEVFPGEIVPLVAGALAGIFHRLGQRTVRPTYSSEGAAGVVRAHW